MESNGHFYLWSLDRKTSANWTIPAANLERTVASHLTRSRRKTTDQVHPICTRKTDILHLKVPYTENSCEQYASQDLPEAAARKEKVPVLILHNPCRSGGWSGSGRSKLLTVYRAWAVLELLDLSSQNSINGASTPIPARFHPKLTGDQLNHI